MSLRILITGGRAPVALELARQFAHAGHDVFVADSVRFPLTRASRCVKQTFYLPSPRTTPAAFIQKLKDTICKNKIDLLVPTCEEIFYISRYWEILSNHCKIFCDQLEKLALCHSKWNFLIQAQNCGVHIPESYRLESIDDINKLPFKPEELVLKPEYSRFASYTLLSPSNDELQKVRPTSNSTWVAQKRIIGKEYCTYSIANEGRLLAHASYHPKYRVGLGSGVFFEPQQHDGILAFVKAFVATIKFHGQIGFDFIENHAGELFVLECNPRATSGAHLFAPGELVNAFLKSDTSLIVANPFKPRMIAPAILIFNLVKEIRAGKFKSLFHQFIDAKDVCFKISDPLPTFYQFVGLGEVLYRSLSRGIGLKDAATSDIEWNGEAF